MIKILQAENVAYSSPPEIFVNALLWLVAVTGSSLQYQRS